MNLKPIIDRIRDECPTLKLVGGAAEFERAVEALATFPAAFVLPAADLAQPNPFGSQIVEQRVGSEFAVVFAVRNLADADGAAAVASLEPVRVVVREALLGWAPAADMDGCEYRAGAMQAFKNGFLWWQDSYLTAYTIRSQ